MENERPRGRIEREKERERRREGWLKPLLLPGHRGERGLRERSARDSKGSRPFRDETIAGSSGKLEAGGGGGLEGEA